MSDYYGPEPPPLRCSDHPIYEDRDCPICDANEEAADDRPAVCTGTVAVWNVLTQEWTERQCGRLNCTDHLPKKEVSP